MQLMNWLFMGMIVTLYTPAFLLGWWTLKLPTSKKLCLFVPTWIILTAIMAGMAYTLNAIYWGNSCLIP